MLTNALRAGIPFETFETSTFWLVGKMVDAAVWRADADRRRRVTQAWQTANFAAAAMSGKLPDLAGVLDPEKGKPAQDPEQQLAAMQAWAARLPDMKYGES